VQLNLLQVFSLIVCTVVFDGFTEYIVTLCMHYVLCTKYIVYIHSTLCTMYFFDKNRATKYIHYIIL